MKEIPDFLYIAKLKNAEAEEGEEWEGRIKAMTRSIRNNLENLKAEILARIRGEVDRDAEVAKMRQQDVMDKIDSNRRHAEKIREQLEKNQVMLEKKLEEKLEKKLMKQDEKLSEIKQLLKDLAEKKWKIKRQEPEVSLTANQEVSSSTRQHFSTSKSHNDWDLQNLLHFWNKPMNLILL